MKIDKKYFRYIIMTSFLALAGSVLFAKSAYKSVKDMEAAYAAAQMNVAESERMKAEMMRETAGGEAQSLQNVLPFLISDLKTEREHFQLGRLAITRGGIGSVTNASDLAQMASKLKGMEHLGYLRMRLSGNYRNLSDLQRFLSYVTGKYPVAFTSIQYLSGERFDITLDVFGTV